MIYLRIMNFDEILRVDCTKLNLLQVEDLKVFRKLIESLTYEDNYEEFFTFFDENSKHLEADEVFVPIVNLMNLDLNSKKNLNVLNKILNKTYYEKLTTDLENIKKEILKIVKMISLELDISITINNEIYTDDLFKIVDVKFSENQKGYFERLLNYLIVVSKIRKKYCFILLHLKEFLTEIEIASLINELSLHEIMIIDIETRNFDYNLSFEKKVIIDKDNCLII